MFFHSVYGEGEVLIKCSMRTIPIVLQSAVDPQCVFFFGRCSVVSIATTALQTIRF